MLWLCHQGGKGVAELGRLGSRPFRLVTWLLLSTDKLSQQALSMVPPRALTPSLGNQGRKGSHLGILQQDSGGTGPPPRPVTVAVVEASGFPS